MVLVVVKATQGSRQADRFLSIPFCLSVYLCLFICAFVLSICLHPLVTVCRAGLSRIEASLFGPLPLPHPSPLSAFIYPTHPVYLSLCVWWLCGVLLLGLLCSLVALVDRIRWPTDMRACVLGLMDRSIRS